MREGKKEGKKLSSHCEESKPIDIYESIIFLTIFLIFTNGKGGCVYIITNKNHTTLYVSITSDLITRIYEHKNKIYRNSFSYRYNLENLLYYETYSSIEEAIAREKQLKGGSRKRKIELINKINPEWKDLSKNILET